MQLVSCHAEEPHLGVPSCYRFCLAGIAFALQPLKNMKPDCSSSATKIWTAALDVFDRKLGRREKYIPGQETIYIRLYERAWANRAVKRYRISGKPLLTG